MSPMLVLRTTDARADRKVDQGETKMDDREVPELFRVGIEVKRLGD